jgi:type II secretory pathway pseudopilin PulG
MLDSIKRSRRDRGDTIVEVLFSITVFSLLAVGSLSIMNQGTAAAQRSLELTLVRQQIDSQAEALRYMQASYVGAVATSATPVDGSPAKEWQTIVTESIDGDATSFGTCDAPSSAFVINTKTVRKYVGYTPADTYARISYLPASVEIDKAAGIWVEAIRSKNFSGVSRYIDFHIRACWYGPGLDQPMTTGTIVRLYEPTV